MNQQFTHCRTHKYTFSSHCVLHKPLSTFSHIFGFLVSDWLGLRREGLVGWHLTGLVPITYTYWYDESLSVCARKEEREYVIHSMQQSNPNTCKHWKAWVLDPCHCVLFVSMHTTRVTLIRLVKVWQQINIRLKRHCVHAHLATWCKKATTAFVFWFKTHTKFLKLYSIHIVLWFLFFSEKHTFFLLNYIYTIIEKYGSSKGEWVSK